MSTGIDRIGALDKAFEFVYKSETNGDYHEFGVYQGVSMARALKVNLAWQGKTGRNHVKHFYGFDSFQGLPAFTEHDWLGDYQVFHEGQFSDTSVNQVKERLLSEGFSSENIVLIAGLFSETLYSLDLASKIGNSKAAIVHIDCDLYSSALDCLRFLDGRLADGAVMLFDDWFCYRGRPDRGVHKAFRDWLSTKKYVVSEYFNYSWAGKAFIINIPNAA